MRTVLIAGAVFFMLQGTGPSLAQIPPSRQFDFWIGSWRISQHILQQDGSWVEFPATTTVVNEGFALVEHWKGTVQFFWEGMEKPEKMRGLSVRSYDDKNHRWQIYWMDSRRPTFGLFEGSFKNGIGSFYRNGIGADGSSYVARITFEHPEPDLALWELAISKDGKTWNALWRMRMTRR